MSGHKNIDKICVSIVAVTVVMALIFYNGKAFGIETSAHTLGYENKLFDNSKVHTINIVMDDWDSFLETCESEVYSACNVEIDGELIKNVGIRGKGNTSLSSVKNMNSSRSSFNPGSFSGMSGSVQNSETTEYILLGGSAFILLVGVLFAAFYKRRK